MGYPFGGAEHEQTTFHCEGCGSRKAAAVLYGKWPLKRNLARGIFHDGTTSQHLYVLVCSWACLQRAHKPTLAEWCAHFGVPYRAPQHYGPRARKEVYA